MASTAAEAAFLSFVSSLNSDSAIASNGKTRVSDTAVLHASARIPEPLLPVTLPTPDSAPKVTTPGAVPLPQAVVRSQSAKINPVAPLAPFAALQRHKSGGLAGADWRTFVTIEDRQSVRQQIRDAYTANTKSYEELLDVVVAVEEELLHIGAPSRLDYIKSSLEFDNRVKLKRKQLPGAASGRVDSEGALKRGNSGDVAAGAGVDGGRSDATKKARSEL